MISIADERDAIQKKTFTKWVNKHLRKVTSQSFFLVFVYCSYIHTKLLKAATDFTVHPSTTISILFLETTHLRGKRRFKKEKKHSKFYGFFLLSVFWKMGYEISPSGSLSSVGLDRPGTSNFVRFREMFQLPFIRIHVTFSRLRLPTFSIYVCACKSYTTNSVSQLLSLENSSGRFLLFFFVFFLNLFVFHFFKKME